MKAAPVDAGVAEQEKAPEPSAEEKKKAEALVRLKADWTNRDPAITAELARYGRNGVPLYLLHAPGQSEPQVLPELLTPGIVLDALARIAPSPVARAADR